MYFDLSKPQKLLQQSVREFCKREVPAARVRELMETESATDDGLWTEMADQGWLGLYLPEEFEGLGLGLVDLAVVAEELGRACVPGPWLSTNWAATLLTATSGGVAADLLPRVADGSARVTIAAFEEAGCWELRTDSLATTVCGGRLNGRKDMVLHAAEADHLICVARQADELSLVLIPISSEGITTVATPGIDPTRRLCRCDFDNVAVAAEQVIASGDAARSALETSQRVATVAVCAEMLGILQWYLETAVEYAKTRKQFDRVIGSFQIVQHMCADLLLLAESARSAVWYAAWALQENREDAARAVSVAKVYASDAVRQAGNLTSQVHGGIGFTWEHDLHLYYKRAKADEYLFGDATFHREQVARMSMGTPTMGDADER